MAKVWKAISSTLAVLLTLSLVIGAGYFVGSFPDEEAEIVEPINPAEEKFDLELPAEVEKRIVTVEEVEVMLVDISQFSTYSGEYTTTKLAEYTRYFLDNIAVPGTTNTINLECKGIVKVGYDVEEITIEVDNDSKKIYISLPAPKVLDNYVIWDTVKCQEENNILNPIDFEQYQALISEIEDDGLALVEADGIYADAEENIITIIRNCLSGFEDFEIIFL
ncbi:DUF4230 domain-containing protein [Ruminococcus sp.]|jgi:hypothetical protein|uniref:DUF4230 domain-containing protein n=1 Tax=Ruminococcus sp. TaxID=41978 RepID=UPI0025FCD6F4|nr:DUF4230 domain-containing protein [Ruminococcus sp.]